MDIKTDLISEVPLLESAPYHIIEQGGLLYISHLNRVNGIGNKITIMNPETGDQKVFTLDHSFTSIQVDTENIYICASEALWIYDIKTMKEKKEISLTINRKDYRNQGFFLLK